MTLRVSGKKTYRTKGMHKQITPAAKYSIRVGLSKDIVKRVSTMSKRITYSVTSRSMRSFTRKGEL